MAKKAAAKGRADLPVSQDAQQRVPTTRRKPSSLLDTRVIYCGDNLEQLAKPTSLCSPKSHLGSWRCSLKKLFDGASEFRPLV
jgi:hypothetical protein